MVDQPHHVRHIATSYDGALIAVAAFQRRVQIWDIDSSSKVSDFDTILDFGGHRLAVSRDGTNCAAGAYHVHGIALYNTTDGAEVWRRKDLKKVQTIRFSADGRRLMCGFEDKAFEPLNAQTGRSKTSLRGAIDFYESVYDQLAFAEQRGRDHKLVNAQYEKVAIIPRTTFAVLDVAFAPGKVCVTESGGLVRCYEVTTGRQIWEHDPGSGAHALRLAYNEANESFTAVVWPFRQGGEYQLLSLKPSSGCIDRSSRITSGIEFAFCKKGSAMISSDGKIRCTATGETEGALDFAASAGWLGS